MDAGLSPQFRSGQHLFLHRGAAGGASSSCYSQTAYRRTSAFRRCGSGGANGASGINAIGNTPHATIVTIAPMRIMCASIPSNMAGESGCATRLFPHFTGMSGPAPSLQIGQGTMNSPLQHQSRHDDFSAGGPKGALRVQGAAPFFGFVDDPRHFQFHPDSLPPITAGSASALPFSGPAQYSFRVTACRLATSLP